MSVIDAHRLRDLLQMIDVELIEQIVGLDAERGWEFVKRHLDYLSGLEKFNSGFLYGLPHGFDHLKKCFYMFWEEDCENVMQCLIYDLAYVGEPIRLHFFARAGYLDHPSSRNVKTSDDLIPYCNWEHNYQEKRPYFDILKADHVLLMSEEMKKNASQVTTELNWIS